MMKQVASIVNNLIHISVNVIAYLFQARVQDVPVVLDGVVPVLVEGPEQLLQALLHALGPLPVELLVAVAAEAVEGVGVARHGELLLLVDLRDDALLVHGLQLPLLRLRLLLQRLHRLLEPLRHLLLEVLGRPGVLLAHPLVLLLQVGPVLHHLRIK